jgi:hypothetical protein
MLLPSYLDIACRELAATPERLPSCLDIACRELAATPERLPSCLDIACRELAATPERLLSCLDIIRELAATTETRKRDDPETRKRDDPAPPAKSTKGVPLAEAEILVREWLVKNAKSCPAGITRDTVAKETGVSTGQVSRTAAWKAFRKKKLKARRKRAFK